MVLEGLDNNRIVLASGSPRRQELLKLLGINFEVIKKEVDEDFPEGMKGEEVALFLSKQKSDAFDDGFFKEPTILITADTVVCLGEEILGKPDDRTHAIEILETLSGCMHQVITAVCLRSRHQLVNFAVTTDVYFKDLREEEILYYVDHYEPYDKAGAYGIQEWIGLVGIEKIHGSFYNVMGLPVLRLYEELLKF